MSDLLSARDSMSFLTEVVIPRGSPLIDKISKKGDENKFKFPLPKVNGGDISYSGTKTAFINFLNKNQTKNIEFINQNINDICASIQQNLIDNLLNKVHLLSVKNNLDYVVERLKIWTKYQYF